MSISSSRTTVCNEVFDENSLPSEEEIRDYAVKIGINPEAEPHLLHLARDGLMQALPPDWKPCYDQDLDSWYYFNFRTGESRWEHPLDDVYRALVRKGRSESCSSAGDDDSKTSLKEDLKSYEEAVSSDMISKNSDPLKGTAVLRKGSLQLTPLRKTGLGRGAMSRAESLPASGVELTAAVAGRPTGAAGDEEAEAASAAAAGTATPWEVPTPPARIDIDKMDLGGSTAARLAKRERLASAQEKHPRTMHTRSELTLSGGGSIFLKSNKAKTPDTPETPLASPGQPPPVIEVVTNSDPNDPIPKGILRGAEPHPRSPQNKPLWDIDPRDMSSEEKQLWRKQELEEEQRKSVRFNLDRELDIRFQVSDSEENGEEEEVEEEELVKEEWNSEDDEPDEERVIAGVKVSDILNLMDASELDEPSAKDIGNLALLPEDNLETQMQHDMVSEDIDHQVDNEPPPAPETWWAGCVVVHQSQTWQQVREESTDSELSQNSELSSYGLKSEDVEESQVEKPIEESVSEEGSKEKASAEIITKDVPKLIITSAPDEKEDSDEEKEQGEEEQDEQEQEQDEHKQEENDEKPELEKETKLAASKSPLEEASTVETEEEPIPTELSANEQESEENSNKEETGENKPESPEAIVTTQGTPGVPCDDAKAAVVQNVKEVQEQQAETQLVAAEPEDELVAEEVIEIEDACGVSEGELDQLEEGQEGDSGKLGISATSLSNLEGLRLSGAAHTEDVEEKEELEDSEDLRFSISPAPVLRPPRLDALRQKGASSPEEDSSTGGGLKRGCDSEQFSLSPIPALCPPRIESLRQKGASSPEDDSSTGGGMCLKRGEDSEEDTGGLQQARDRELLREAQRLVEERHQHMFRLQTESQRMLRAFQEQLQMNTDTAVHRLEEEHAHQLAQLQEQLLGEEEAECERLQEEVAGRLTRMQEQLHSQENSIRENMEKSLTALKERFTMEHQAQLEEHRILLESRLAEEHQRLEVESAGQIEALRLNLEESNRRRIEEVQAALETEGKVQAEKLREQMEAKRVEVAEHHQKELEEVEAKAQALLAERLEARLQELEAAALAQASRQLEVQLEARRQELLEEQRVSMEQLRLQHQEQRDQIRLEHKEEEELLRREHAERLEETRVRLELERQRAREREIQNEEKEREKLLESARILEKLRCEKRLLEDKYRSLKEKYIRLKTDVKLSIERRKRREGGGTTTGSETERSTSHTRTSATSAAAVVAAGRPPDSERAVSGVSPRPSGSAAAAAATAALSAGGVPRRNGSKRNSAEASSSAASNSGSSPLAPPAVAAGGSSGGASASGDSHGRLSAGVPLKSAGKPPPAPQPPPPLEPVVGGRRRDDGPLSPPADSETGSSSRQAPPKPTADHVDNHNNNSNNNNANNNRRRRQLFGRLKSASTSRLTNNVNSTNNNCAANLAETSDDGSVVTCSPVENLRRQLKKLEDLEDQFPVTTHTDTYLRYPFSDAGQFGSSELEFFRHRIHLERDSVRRAKDFLRVQRSSFLNRQRELKQRQVDGSATARSMLDQLYQEERELTDMEVSLHRTRSLLGEKIIRLRHLEQSLHRVGDGRSGGERGTTGATGNVAAPPDDTAATLSDLSSHSGSSGFSSTELGTDTPLGRSAARGLHYQESNEIIQSLENLNSEIREIWEVLNKQQKEGTLRSALPPPPLVYPELGWPTLAGARGPLAVPERMQAFRQQYAGAQRAASQATSMDQSLVERTRSLREWLRQARIDTADLVSPPQASL